jgi:uncharacterized damage-inducible protein DinB
MDEAMMRIALAKLVAGKGAHANVERALTQLPPEVRARRPEGLVHSVWELLEHIRLAQQDILRYTFEPDWRSPEWPKGYWPETNAAEVSDQAWERSLAGFRSDLAGILRMVEDTSLDLTAQIPHGRPGHTYLREALLVADHNAYHAGQIVDVRRALGAWA